MYFYRLKNDLFNDQTLVFVFSGWLNNILELDQGAIFFPVQFTDTDKYGLQNHVKKLKQSENI